MSYVLQTCSFGELFLLFSHQGILKSSSTATSYSVDCSPSKWLWRSEQKDFSATSIDFFCCLWLKSCRTLARRFRRFIRVEDFPSVAYIETGSLHAGLESTIGDHVENFGQCGNFLCSSRSLHIYLQASDWSHFKFYNLSNNNLHKLFRREGCLNPQEIWNSGPCQVLF